jgi:hypothetical protein
LNFQNRIVYIKNDAISTATERKATASGHICHIADYNIAAAKQFTLLRVGEYSSC